MKRLLFICVLFMAAFAVGQTAVTLQVTDTDGVAWANGNYTVAPVGPASPSPYRYNGTVITPQSGNLNASGVASLSLYGNDLLAPALSKYRFTVCSGTVPPTCVTNDYTITGVSQTVNYLPAGIRINMTNPAQVVNAYTATEVQATIIGQQYVNLTDGKTYTCALLPCSANWQVVGGGSGSVTGQANGVIPLATGPSAIGAQSHLDDGVTTPGVITSTEPITMPSGTITGTPTNNSDIDTVGARNNAIGLGGALPFTPLAAYYAFNASGTTLTDSSGNGYNGTFGGGGSASNQPSIVNNNSIVFSPSAGTDQWITIPYQALGTANTVLVFFKNTYPPTNEWAVTQGAGKNPMLSDCQGSGIVPTPSRFGNMALWSYAANSETTTPTDRMVGNAYLALVYSGTWSMYPFGHSPTGYLYNPTPNTFNCSSGSAYIGHSFVGGASSNGSGWSGTLYALLTFTQALTQAQIQQASTYIQGLLTQRGITFSEPYFPTTMVYTGDSRTAFYPYFNLAGSRPYTVSKMGAGREQFWNFGRSGILLNNLNTTVSSVECPILSRYASSSRVVVLDAIINDIYGGTCASSGACMTTINTFGNNIINCNGSNGSNAVSTVYVTPLPYLNMTQARELIRESTAAAVTSAAIAGTLKFDAVADLYNDPIAATQTTPNVYATSGAAAMTGSSTSFVTSQLYTITVSGAIPPANCYAGQSVTLSGMTPAGYNGTYVITAGMSNPQTNVACFGNTFQVSILGAGLGTATVFGTAAFANGPTLNVTAASSPTSQAQNTKQTTFTFTAPIPTWQCYPGAMWQTFGFTPSNENTGMIVPAVSCSGSSVVLNIWFPNTVTVQGTAQYYYNPQWFFDGIHENANLIGEMASQENVAILAAQNRLKDCTVVTKTIPWQVLAASQATTAGTTQTIPLLQLYPGWQVCSVAANVSSGFSGTGIATLTMSIGDSNGTATQYSSAGNIMATGWAVAPNTNPTVPSSPNGMVQMNLTSTGGNIAAVSAGQMTVSIGVIKP